MEKRYNSYVDHFRSKYGDRLQKLVLDAGFTCPNRDGTVGTGGCTYCDNAAFHPGYSTPDKPLFRQIEEGIEFHRVRYPRTSRYLAYFQAFSNTYAPLACARKAVEMTAARGLETGAHFILGLPGESPQMLLEQCSVINSLPLTSVKFHQLQIIKGTAMEKEFENSPQDFWRPGLDEYLELIVDILERLRPDLCIERIAGEVPPRFVRETPWGLVRNFQILKMLDARLEDRDTHQGRLFK